MDWQNELHVYIIFNYWSVQEVSSKIIYIKNKIVRQIINIWLMFNKVNILWCWTVGLNWKHQKI